MSHTFSSHCGYTASANSANYDAFVLTELELKFVLKQTGILGPYNSI